MDKHKELTEVRNAVKEYLNALGYNGDDVAKDIVEVTGYFKGKPSEVKMADGTTMYL